MMTTTEQNEDLSANSANALSLIELQRLVASRKAQLDGLLKRREILAEQLREVDALIEDINGGRVRHNAPQARTLNSTSLRPLILQLLTQNRRGYSLRDLVDQVLRSGYVTQSSNFQTVVYQAIYNCDEIMFDQRTRLYRLKD
jgi:hypothetical protein